MTEIPQAEREQKADEARIDDAITRAESEIAARKEGYAGLSEDVNRGSKEGKRRILIVDDLLATGGTAMATVRLVQKLGSEVVGCAFVIELKFLNGRARLAPIECTTLIDYE